MKPTCEFCAVGNDRYPITPVHLPGTPNLLECLRCGRRYERTGSAEFKVIDQIGDRE